MSHQVLARKYRPQNFEEVVGQSAIVTTLKNAIQKNRLHHAYLFTGARGIGKTSLARIFAKALHCEKGPTPTPCNACSLCLEITAGTSLDVQEIDGASNTSVDHVRELKEGLKYLPVAARSKIFIIDEVHMLSTSAFNALLKTLEEPPPHVLFLMATTESHKIPATILSRCQRFDLKRLSTDQVANQLAFICEKEAVSFEPDALRMIARASEGSLRDSQSLLDQALTYTKGELKLEKVRELLGFGTQNSFALLTEAVLKKEIDLALETVANLYQQGSDLRYWVSEWLQYWQALLIYSTTQNERFLEDWTADEKTALIKTSKLTTPALLDLGFRILYQSLEEIARSEFPKILLEVCVLRIAHAAEILDLGQAIKNFDPTISALKNPEQNETEARQSVPPPEPSKQRTISSVIDEPQNASSNNIKDPADSSNLQSTKKPSDTPNQPKKGLLDDFIRALSERWPQIGSIFEEVKNISFEADRMVFQFEVGSLWLDLLLEKKDLIGGFANNFFGRPIEVVIIGDQIQTADRSTRSGASIEANAEKSPLDPRVESALRILDAKIVKTV